MRKIIGNLQDEIARRLSSGEFPPDRPLPSCRELGKLLGVSHGTVNSALKMLAEKGYLEETLGQKLYPIRKKESQGSSRINSIIAIGTDYYGENESYYRPFVDAFSKEARGRRVSFEFHKIHGLSLRCKANEDFRLSLFRRGVSVVVMAPLRSHDIAFLSRLRVPYLVLNNFYNTDSPCLVIDDRKTAQILASLALETGYRAMGMIKMSSHKQGECEFVLNKYLKEECEAKGLSFSAGDILFVEKIDEHLNIALTRFLKKKRQATMFLTGGDAISKAALQIRKGLALNRHEFINYAESLPNICKYNILPPYAEMVTKAVCLLLREEFPDRKLIQFPPVLSSLEA